MTSSAVAERAVCECGEIAGPVGWCRECLVERLGEDEGRSDYDAAGDDEEYRLAAKEAA